MQERTRLGVNAGMYHEWDKKLRDWLRHRVRVTGSETVRKALEDRVPSILDLLVAFGFDPKTVASYQRLDAMRLWSIVKHGDGRLTR